MAGNPKTSIWYQTPPEKRHRKGIMLTLPPEAIKRLTALAKQHEMSRSAFVEFLLTMWGGK